MNETNPQSESVAANSELTKAVSNHLEFLGYAIQKDDGYWICDHPQRSKILLDERTNGLILTAIFNLKPTVSDNPLEFLKFVNDANATLMVGRVFWDLEKGLWIQAWYSGPYERVAFGSFFDLWSEGFDRFFNAHEEAGRAYLE